MKNPSGEQEDIVLRLQWHRISNKHPPIRSRVPHQQLSSTKTRRAPRGPRRAILRTLRCRTPRPARGSSGFGAGKLLMRHSRPNRGVFVRYPVPLEPLDDVFLLPTWIFQFYRIWNSIFFSTDGCRRIYLSTSKLRVVRSYRAVVSFIKRSTSIYLPWSSKIFWSD